MNEVKKRLELKLIKTLTDPVNPHIFVSAASGLVKLNNTFYVIADDELTLASFTEEKKSSLQLISLLKGKLPENPKERKKQKPDWESLVVLNLTAIDRILLAVPSGSTDQRMTGLSTRINSSNKIDFSKLYLELKKTFKDLNIEGACVFKDHFKLFQRGNGLQSKNAVIDLDLSGVIHDLTNGQSLNPERITQIKTYDLGNLNKHKLDFTDVCCVGNRIWFLAVAENSESTYDDGDYQGSVLGCLDQNGDVVETFELNCPEKPEGLWVESYDGVVKFYIVTDADNRETPASFYEGVL